MEENHFNCIYCYTNKVNGKRYVGQAVDFIKRHKQHICASYNEERKGYNLPFHNAIRKYEIKNFKIEILKENLQNQDELNYWEKFYIAELDTLANNNKGYNLASGGSNGNNFAGKTDEEKAEISRKISEAYHNKSDEEKAEIRRKNSKANKGENHPMFGKHHSEETRAKQSEAHKGLQAGENHPCARKVVQLNPLTKEVIRIWDYKKQISEELGYNRKTIKKYLQGKGKLGHLFKGFLWYYLDEWEQLTK